MATSGVAEGTNGLDVIVAAAGVTVHGRGGNDRICTEGGHVQGGKGNDRIILLDTGAQQRGTIEAGSGHDSLGLGDPEATDVAVYLDGRATWDDLRVDIRLDGVEDLRVSAMRADVRGDGADNDIVVQGCEAFALGGAGADVLVMMRRPGTCPPPEDQYAVTFIGGEGNDELFRHRSPRQAARRPADGTRPTDVRAPATSASPRSSATATEPLSRCAAEWRRRDGQSIVRTNR